MDSPQARRAIVAMFAIAIAIVAWREIKAGADLPSPHAFLGSFMVYGGLALGAEFAAPLAAALAAGYTLGLLYYSTSPDAKLGSSSPPKDDTSAAPREKKKPRKPRDRAAGGKKA